MCLPALEAKRCRQEAPQEPELQGRLRQLQERQAKWRQCQLQGEGCHHSKWLLGGACRKEPREVKFRRNRCNTSVRCLRSSNRCIVDQLPDSLVTLTLVILATHTMLPPRATCSLLSLRQDAAVMLPLACPLARHIRASPANRLPARCLCSIQAWRTIHRSRP